MARCKCGCSRECSPGREFVHGHNRRGVTLSEETRAKVTGRPISASADRSSIHTWLRKHHPLVGLCQDCGLPGRTEFAYLNHPATHTRERSDYRELCRSCHFKMDEALYQRGRNLNAGKTREQLQAAGKKGAARRWHLTCEGS